MSKDKIHLPGGQSGLVRYFEDEEASKFVFKPIHIVIFAAVASIVILLLHAFAKSWFGI